jgi:hypothetical protein
MRNHYAVEARSNLAVRQAVSHGSEVMRAASQAPSSENVSTEAQEHSLLGAATKQRLLKTHKLYVRCS